MIFWSSHLKRNNQRFSHSKQAARESLALASELLRLHNSDPTRLAQAARDPEPSCKWLCCI